MVVTRHRSDEMADSKKVCVMFLKTLVMLLLFLLRVRSITFLSACVTDRGDLLLFKDLRERNLEQSLAMKKEMPSDRRDVWQLIGNLREEMQRLEDETKRRLTVQTRVNRALT